MVKSHKFICAFAALALVLSLAAIVIPSQASVQALSDGNNPPNVPSNPLPTNYAADVSINAYLSWIGGDPDAADMVTYDVYFGTSLSPTFKERTLPYSATQSPINYSPGILNYNTTYYWQIVAWDNHGTSTPGPVWQFTTGAAPNNPPKMPSSPLPTNYAIDVSIDVPLSWVGGDPDVGDMVTYDVYFGTSLSPTFKERTVPYSATQSPIIYNPGTLNYNTKYYWQVVAWDNHGDFSTGPVWEFTTQTSDIFAYYRGLGLNPDVVETTDLLNAIGDWAGGTIPPGFTQAISTIQLLQLIGEWAG